MNTKTIFQPTMFEDDLEEQNLISQVNELEDFVNLKEDDLFY
ncbi:hypothetical protein [Aquimarina sp. ERC-38]|nr:hypothetical protein [Aquimarina sp. ERC-38]